MVVESDGFKNNKQASVKAIQDFAGGSLLAVRSSSVREDTLEYSNAGKFESILNVKPNEETIAEAVMKVYESYGTDENEEILIQPMLSNIKKSGVVFTVDIDTYADYYTVNFFEGTDSAAVTGGSRDGIKTYVKYKNSPVATNYLEWDKLLDVCGEIEKFLNNHALDIEFAITEDDEVYILQVRPIARGDKSAHEKVNLDMHLWRVYKKVKKLSQRHPFLLGDTTCFGVMPDWNPAEILGVRPKKLSISLYKELITDNVWAHQRYDYGYRDLTMHPLMISFCGIPYVDTRITFNSFIPRNLNDAIAEKLVNYYIHKMIEYPKYHDKVEFEIVFSCYYMGLPEKLKTLLDYGFNENEIKRIEFSLLELTNNIIDPKDGLYKKDIEKVSVLEKNYDKIMQSDISLVDRIYWLLEECKAYGTLPFAGAARAGFIAVQFLRSFVDAGIIDKNMYDRYMNSLNTVNKRMNRDLRKCCQGEISKEEFLSVYGHIRPGTYDITSKRYDEAFDEYFGDNIIFDSPTADEQFEFSGDIMEKIQLELEQNGLLISAQELMTFIREAIEGREYLKFVFTKAVSEILQLIGELGKRLGIEKEDMAHIDISLIRSLYSDLYSGNIANIFMDNIRVNKQQYESAVQIKMPSMIVSPESIYGFYLLDEEPNYITNKSVTSDVVNLSEATRNYFGKIVFIQAADPGYDFLFSKKIGGLVTQFGGANSHMAIRCAELGIPAIIGVGEKNFTEWSKYKRMTIDCLKRQVVKIS
jgi:phosphohistidine swiveling domain-containing protein